MDIWDEDGIRFKPKRHVVTDATMSIGGELVSIKPNSVEFTGDLKKIKFHDVEFFIEGERVDIKPNSVEFHEDRGELTVDSIGEPPSPNRVSITMGDGTTWTAKTWKRFIQVVEIHEGAPIVEEWDEDDGPRNILPVWRE